MTLCDLWFIIMLLVGHNSGKMNNMGALKLEQWLPVKPQKAAGFNGQKQKEKN